MKNACLFALVFNITSTQIAHRSISDRLPLEVDGDVANDKTMLSLREKEAASSLCHYQHHLISLISFWVGQQGRETAISMSRS